MANDVWYYSHGDAEKGPVTRSQLDAMARSGQLKADDLVWHEGMEDWQTAASAGIVTVPGPKASTAGRGSTPPPQPAGATLPTVNTGTSPGTGSSTGSTNPATRSSTPMNNANLRQVVIIAGQALIIFGMLFVLLGQGCERLAIKQARRHAAKYELAQRRFTNETDEEVTRRQVAIDRIDDKEDKTDTDYKRIDDLQKELDEYRDERDKDREALQKTEWMELSNTANTATLDNAAWSPTFYSMFMLGSFLLVVGLFGVGFTGQGADRWICLVMLAIVVFSLYIVGQPWLPVDLPPDRF